MTESNTKLFQEKRNSKTDSNTVAEEQEQYQVLVPYLKRQDLTNSEKVAIGNYQDVYFWNTQKQNWSFEIPENWKEKANCFAINSCCRSFEFYDSVSEDEKEWINEHFQFLDSAIDKSRLPGKRNIFKGVKNTNWLPEDHGIDTEYIDLAYGSFSLSLEKALQYSNEDDLIIFQQVLTEEMKALYIDTEEYEVLRPRNRHCRIRNIFKIRILTQNGFKTVTIYRIEEIGDEF